MILPTVCLNSLSLPLRDSEGGFATSQHVVSFNIQFDWLLHLIWSRGSIQSFVSDHNLMVNIQSDLQSVPQNTSQNLLRRTEISPLGTAQDHGDLLMQKPSLSKETMAWHHGLVNSAHICTAYYLGIPKWTLFTIHIVKAGRELTLNISGLSRPRISRYSYKL